MAKLMSHIENSAFARNFVNRVTEQVAVSTAVVVLPLSIGVAKAGPDTISPENRSPLVAASSENNKNISRHVEAKSQKALQQEAWKFIQPDPQDIHDAKTKPATLGAMENSVHGPVFAMRQKDNVYDTTSFGGYDDPEDNGVLKYEDDVRRLLSNQSQSWKDKLEGKSGKEFEDALEYYSAGAGPKGEAQFGVQKIKLTSPTGEVVIVVAGDEGPRVDVQDEGARFDMSKPALSALGNPDKVVAEPVPPHLEKFIQLGPVKIKQEKSKSKYSGKIIVRRK